VLTANTRREIHARSLPAFVFQPTADFAQGRSPWRRRLVLLAGGYVLWRDPAAAIEKRRLDRGVVSAMGSLGKMYDTINTQLSDLLYVYSD
jgi:hypothetical protein